MSKNQPHFLDSIIEILLTCLYTSCVTGAVPVSMVLVADSGTAKSKLLKACIGPHIHVTDSFSSQGLFELMTRDTKNEIHWLVTPDMNPTLSRPQRTVTAAVANLLTLTMDGTCRIDDGRSEKQMQHKPIGFLSAITPDIYVKQAKKWLALGLRRRIIPLFYEYSSVTLMKLKEALRNDRISGADFAPFLIPEAIATQQHLPLINETESLHLEALGTQFSNNLGLSRMKDDQGHVRWYVKNIVPISPIATLRTLARANAIRSGRGKVNNQDIEFLTGFLDFTNPSSPKAI